MITLHFLILKIRTLLLSHFRLYFIFYYKERDSRLLNLLTNRSDISKISKFTFANNDSIALILDGNCSPKVPSDINNVSIFHKALTKANKKTKGIIFSN